MERVYDVFEKMPDGDLIWRVTVVGRQAAIRKLLEMGAHSPREFHLMHLTSNTVIAKVNAP
jgi:hypothetical protein